MTEPITERLPTTAQIMAANMMIERYERGVGPEPSDAIRRLAKAKPADLPDLDKWPTRAEVLAANMAIERYERGVGPKPSEAVRRLAKATPKD